MKIAKPLFVILTVTAALAIQVQAQSFLTNGLVAYYPFNGNANDVSGNGNTGTLTGSDSKFLADRFGNTNSLWLNATSTPAWNLNGAYMSASRSASLDFNSDFTLSVWVNFTNTSPLPNGVPGQGFVHNLISDGNDSSSFNLRVLTDNTPGKDSIQVGLGVSGGGGSVQVDSLREKWWQISVVRSGTNFTLYKNGSVLKTGIALTTVNTSTVLIGRHGTGGGNGSYYPLVGGIDDVRMYNRALPPTEVQELYQVERGPHTDIARAVRLDHTGLQMGATYQLQFSYDLTNWTNFGSPVTANTSTNSQYLDVTDWNTFWRLNPAP